MTAAFEQQTGSNGAVWLDVPAWRKLSWLWHGFSTRLGGVSRAYLPGQPEAGVAGELNLGFTVEDDEGNVRENRLRLLEAVTGSREMPLATVRQIHSCRTVPAEVGTAAFPSGAIPQADGLITRRAGLLLGIQTADCIPVLVVDPVLRAVGAFHAGWRGTVERIVEEGIGSMVASHGSDPGTLLAAIGPGIGNCCYRVGEEVRDRFGANFPYAAELFRSNETEGLRLDLWEANRRQLLAAGVRSAAIQTVGGCTSCLPKWFYSHRASGGRAGRMMAVVGIRPDAD